MTTLDVTASPPKPLSYGAMKIKPFLTLEGLRLLFEKNRMPRDATPRKEK